MRIVGDKMNQDQFRVLVRNYNFGTIPPTSLVIHHTWRPTKAQWKGETSLFGIKNYYEQKGWNAGPHLFIADDGIWSFTPMKDVGIHAGKGNATYAWRRLKSYSIGIEIVGDYDKDTWSGATKSNALAAIRALQERLGIENEDVRFHRDFSSKSCPGHAITKEWLFKELGRKDAEGKNLEQVNNVSEWAQDGFDWADKLGFDRSVHPNQKVEAEWVFAILKKYHDKFNK